MGTESKVLHNWRLRFIDATDDALLLTDGNVVLDCNQRAVALFRCMESSQLVGSSLLDLTPDRHSILVACDEDTGGAVTGTHTDGLVRQDGERFTALVSVSVLVDPGSRAFVVSLRDITSRLIVQQEDGLLEQAYLMALFERSPEAIAIVDRNGIVLRVNSFFGRVFGYRMEEVVGRDIDQLIVPESNREEGRDLTRTGLSGMEVEYQTWRRRKSGEIFPTSVLAAPIFHNGSLVALYVIYRDISRLREVEQKLKQAQRQLDAVISQAPITIFLLDAETRFAMSVGQVMDRAGWKESDLLGQSAYDFFAEMPDVLSAIRLSVSGQTARVVTEFRGTSLELQFTPIQDADGGIQSIIGVMRDVTDSILAQKQLEFMAHHDILTGLPNRKMFQEQVRDAIRRAKRHKSGFAVLFLDLDRFKAINDALGHQTGDQVIQHAAVQCASILREVDLVARLGGDEFAILLEEVEKNEQIETVIRRLQAAISVRYFDDDRDLTVECSIGISLYPRDGLDEEALIKNADTAMYKAKSSGRGRYMFYTPDLPDSPSGEYAKTTLLRRALEQEHFVLHYQPIVRTSDLAVTGVEALIRLRQSDGHLMPPLEFIALAEETGLIIPIGSWVLQEACRQQRAWLEKDAWQLRMAINLSARQFRDPEFLATIGDMLSKMDIPPELFMVEITESMMFPDPRTALAILAELRALRVAVSIDDFGTGFSSLSYLKDFSVDFIKTDRSFIAGTPNDKKSCGITRTILSLSRNLGMGMIAEGVETAGQYRFLQTIGCDEMQGFFFGRPVDSETLSVRFEQSPIKDHQPILQIPEN